MKMSEYSAAFQSAKVAVTWLQPAFRGVTIDKNKVYRFG